MKAGEKARRGGDEGRSDQDSLSYSLGGFQSGRLGDRDESGWTGVVAGGT